MNKRLILVFLSFMLTSVLLFLRVGSLSVDEPLAKTAQTQSRYTLTFNRTRRLIYDCRLNRLVDEDTRYLAACLPTSETLPRFLNNQTLLLGESPEEKSALLTSGKPFLAESRLPQTGIPLTQVFEVPIRTGKNQLAPHIIGYTQDGEGVSGLEKALNDYLNEDSQTSRVTYAADGRRSVLAGAEIQTDLAPIPTAGVVLTLDNRIQEVIERIGAKSIQRGAVIVMEPSTGKIRAAASFPSYSASHLTEAMQDTENAPLLNRTFASYCVGSTFKIATAAAALSQGLPAETMFECKGWITVKGQTFRCHDLAGHGWITMDDAFKVSCNPYFIQLAQQFDPQVLRNLASDLSFGREAEFLPGYTSSSGSLPDAEELERPAGTANFSFGQGSLSATPIQVAQMVCAVVNGGSTPAARLVEGYTDSGQVIDEPAEELLPVQAMTPEIAALLQEMLTACVMENENQYAKPQYVTAGGKTGTAQTGQLDENGKEKYLGWFAGFFPAESPRYVVSVVVEEARSGNQDASPVFQEIADALYAPVQMPAKLANR